MAALSAAPCAVAASVEAQMRSAQVADVVSGNLGVAVEVVLLNIQANLMPMFSSHQWSKDWSR